MDRKELDKWIAAYIMYESEPNKGRYNHPLFWAVEKFMELVHMDEIPEEYFQAILEVLKRDPGDKVLGVLAAGPLEDLIHYHGSQYIDRIEEEARRNPKFRHLLGGVWQSGTPDIWIRIERARGAPW
jgi:hypothetical protein